MSELFIGHSTQDNSVISLNSNDLMTHGLVVGRTGSGKTGLIHVLIEEAVMSGVSAVIIDPKGDLTNLSLSFPGLSASEFAPWVPAGKNPVDEATRWIDGLKSTDQDLSRVAEWHNSASVNIYTPGFTKTGQSVNLLPSFNPPATPIDSVALRDRASHAVDTIMSAIGSSTDPMTDPNYVFLTELLIGFWSRGKTLQLEKLSGYIVDPPDYLNNIDGICIDDFISHRERMKLARAIIGFRRQAARWLEGNPLDMDSFLMPTEEGLPRVSIFTLRHLNEDDRMLFTSMFLSNLVSWMYKAPASGRLRALCVLDEASGYLPPHPYSPPTKRPISILLSQGRAQGLGMLLGTQNPNDIDYKALSNIGTWFLGGLRERDLKRDLDSEIRGRGVDPAKLLKLPDRSFMFLTKDGKSQVMNARWSLSYLRGPIDSEHLTCKSSAAFGDIIVGFDLTSDKEANLDVDVKYSVDGGKLWRDATPSEDSPPLLNLSSTPSGVNHSFKWNSIHDLGFNFVSKVRVAIHVRDSGTFDVEPFDIDNSIIELIPA
jgi:hypothetical protein